MPSTYTTRLRLEKQADGENIGTWGDVLNEQLIDLLDDANKNDTDLINADISSTINDYNNNILLLQ